MRSPITVIVRGVLRLGPRPFRERFGSEIAAAMDAALADERKQYGWVAMVRLGGRGVADAVRTVNRERRLAAGDGGRGPMADWRSDVKYVLRGWRRAPAFSATVLLTLGLGIGFAAAIFSFADGYLFRPLPFPAADRVFFVDDPVAQYGSLKAKDTLALRQTEIRDLGFVEWGVGGLSGDLMIDDRRVQVLSYEVSEGFRKTLELPLLRGRDFTSADHLEVEAPLPVWLSYRFWQREFAASESVVGTIYKVKAPRPPFEVRVVGVLGPQVASFDLNNDPPDLVVPERGQPVVGPNHLSFPLIRIPADSTLEQTTARIAATLQSVAPAADGRARTVRLRSLREYQVAGGRPTARVFFAGALLVLLLVALNLVHLLLTRSIARGKEIATRAALGASRWRIARLFLAESLLLAIVGISAGLWFGRWLSGVISAHVPMVPSNFRNLALVPMSFDARVMAFAVGAGVIVACVGGLWPAWHALRRPLSAPERGIRASVPARWSRTILASELAVATVVLVGTCFIGVGIWRYLHPALGFAVADRVVVAVYPSDERPMTAEDTSALRSRLGLVPGVTASGQYYPESSAGVVDVPGTAFASKTVGSSTMTIGYAAAWGIPLRAGRWFEDHEFRDDAGVAIVDERFAALVWPDRNPLGQDLRVAGLMRRVVGVVAPRRMRLTQESMPKAFVPSALLTADSAIVVWAPSASLDVMRQRLTRAVRDVVPGAHVRIEPVTLDALFIRDVGEARFQAPIIGAFGGLAVLLAGVGIFGLVSYLVAHRLREFGIRIALGAQPRNIWQAVIRESVAPAMVGLAVGLPSALALESVVQSTVFGWKSSGPLAALIVGIALLAVAIAAAVPPARRAMRVDPVQVLRAE